METKRNPFTGTVAGHCRTGTALLGLFVLALVSPMAGVAWDNYGAIAHSRSSGAWGYSYDYPSRSVAENRAMAECRARGRGCEVVVWFRNACGALAVASGGARGWGWAGSRGEAESIALDYCRQYGGGDCEVKCWACTSR